MSVNQQLAIHFSRYKSSEMDADWDVLKQRLPIGASVNGNRNHDIEAEIRFLTTDAGGRRTPVMSGYRPNHDFGIPDMMNDAQHEYIDKDRVFPGEPVNARLWFLRPDFQIGRLYIGMPFTVQEGARLVGNGKITRVCNPELQKAT